MPLPWPAPAWTSTRWPVRRNSSAPTGSKATRYSSDFTSRGTPTIMGHLGRVARAYCGMGGRFESSPTIAARPACCLSSEESPHLSRLISTRCPMPPRPLAAAIVVAWLAAIGWLAHDKWLPWFRPADEPAFLVELADEVAPEHASWLVYRHGKRIGSAETRLSPRKDGLFEMTSRLRDVDFKMSLAQVKMPVFATTRLVTRDGDLVSLESHAVMMVTGLGGDLKVEADIKGRVEGD